MTESVAQFLRTFSILGLLFSVVACSQKPDNSLAIHDNDSQPFQSYSIDLESPSVRLTELLEEVRIVRLEETEASLLASVWNTRYENGYYIIPEDEQRSLCFFDASGSFVQTFDRSGEGPEEYKAITSFWIKDDTINIYDQVGSNHVRYLRNGLFIDKSRIDFELSFLIRKI